MNNCDCQGHYHDSGCSDQNVIFWLDVEGKLPQCGIPVNPTDKEIAAQKEIIKKHLKLHESARILSPKEMR